MRNRLTAPNVGGLPLPPMKRFFCPLLAAALVCAGSIPVPAAPPPGTAPAQAKAETLFSTIIAGDTSKAFDGLLAGSVIADHQSGAAYALRNQLENGMRAYGRPVGFDLVEEKTFGSSLVRFVYVLRLEKYPLIWEFFFYKSGDAWQPIEVRFNDQLAPFKFDRPVAAPADSQNP
ncbi:MAG: hypothetical protein INR65_10915 [Gluconacetobacter diazotrophicus]|nr:hypothetical protein [Gluconacetobacter diazotrophicus]